MIELRINEEELKKYPTAEETMVMLEEAGMAELLSSRAMQIAELLGPKVPHEELALTVGRDSQYPFKGIFMAIVNAYNIGLMDGKGCAV